MTDRSLFTGTAVNFSEYGSLPAGQVSLVNRVKYVACLPHPWKGGVLGILTESAITGVIQTLLKGTIPFCSSNFSPMACRRTAWRTERWRSRE